MVPAVAAKLLRAAARPEASELATARNSLRKPLTSDLASARDDLVTEIKDDELLSDILPHLWAASGGGPNGQFCAEPKAFEHVRTGNLIERGVDAGKSRVVVVGQLALWYSGGKAPRDFSDSLRIIGPSDKRKTSASGGYMLPCSSCAARSGVMMDGLTLTSQVIGTPKLFVSEDFQLDQRCAVCGKSTIQRCARCAAVFYCGKEHQRRDWARHKKLCRP
ncbi:zinc finger MYND domain-containing protein [Enhygromyxa salina]|uniref:zinc finger MYND domain-containing protein n=1 Tax=Enhygromyxa salina TaxID=215803 RepID=UPI00069732EF|nr:zinc finger MYND domain-containing protein [Enhygromyxa salina]